jgi:hypothetical protein
LQVNGREEFFSPMELFVAGRMAFGVRARHRRRMAMGATASRDARKKRANRSRPKLLRPESAMIGIDYRPRAQFAPFHSRRERFACIVTHRRAGKTVACIHDLHRAAITCARTRPRFAYMSPFLKQSKSVAWDYLRAAVAAGRAAGASIHASELRVDYPSGAQVRLFGCRQRRCAARALSRRHRAR